MDPALAAQISEAVAEKMLQYRRDESGWKICREGVSEELGRKGSKGLCSVGPGFQKPPGCPSPGGFLRSILRPVLHTMTPPPPEISIRPFL